MLGPGVSPYGRYAGRVDSALSAWPTADLLARASKTALASPLAARDGDHWPLVVELHRRGTRQIFAQAAAWCASPEPRLRTLGADLLGQLGFAAAHPFAAESTPVLVALLGDAEPAVTAAALTALGHLGTGDAADIAALSGHASTEVRFAVASCLCNRPAPAAVEALIGLSRDVDPEVRDWATFGLGSLVGVDSEAIRLALLARLDDPDPETRGEAMVGLAVRGDRRAEAAIRAALAEPGARDLVFEAARELELDV
jgi:HEAT repeat protein